MYYETALRTVLGLKSKIVSITSFNEWHEGTRKFRTEVLKHFGDVSFSKSIFKLHILIILPLLLRLLQNDYISRT